MKKKIHKYTWEDILCEIIANPKKAGCFILFVIGLVVAVIFGIGWLKSYIQQNAYKEGEKITISSAALKEVLQISELTSAEYIYNGIAQGYQDPEEKKGAYYIRYSAMVEAGADLGKIDLKINEKNDTIEIVKPKIEIFNVSMDYDSLDFIPENLKSQEVKDILATCKEDVRNEAASSGTFVTLAQSNSEHIIEALLDPLAKSSNMPIVWKEPADEKE